jgi:hypothetical protein
MHRNRFTENLSESLGNHSQNPYDRVNKYSDQAQKKNFDRKFDGRTCHDSAEVANPFNFAKHKQLIRHEMQTTYFPNFWVYK